MKLRRALRRRALPRFAPPLPPPPPEPQVSLTIAPLIKGEEDFASWYWGIFPLGAFAGVTYELVRRDILTWRDPLAFVDGGAGDPGPAASPRTVDRPKERPSEASESLMVAAESYADGDEGDMEML